MKKLLAVAVALTLALGVAVNDPGDVLSSNDATPAGDGELVSLPPVDLVAHLYITSTLGPNDCSEWDSNSAYWHFGWNFNHTDLDGLTKEQVGGLDSSVPPSTGGTMHAVDPGESGEAIGWNYWWTGSADSTQLHLGLVILKTSITGNPCNNPTRAEFTVGGSFINGDTWSVLIHTAT